MAFANYRNNLNASVLAIVLWVVHNNIGQTVGFGAATIDLAPGANATANPTIYSLPSGTFNSTIFAISTSGVAVSNSTSLGFTLSG